MAIEMTIFELKDGNFNKYRNACLRLMDNNPEIDGDRAAILKYLICVWCKNECCEISMKYAYIAKVLQLKYSTVQRIFREFVNAGVIRITVDGKKRDPQKYYYCDWVADEYTIIPSEIPHFKRPKRKSNVK